MSEDFVAERARMKAVTEMKRHELNKAMKDGRDVEFVRGIAKEIISMAENKFELKDLLDPVGYNNYIEYVGND